MADTIILTGNALTAKLFSRELFVEAKKSTYMERFVGKDSGSAIQVLEDTQKHPGDQITWGLRMQATGLGVKGDADLEGQEEALTLYSDSVLIDQLRHAHKLNGNMSQQRIAYNLRQQMKSSLADWFSGRYDASILNQLSGNSAQTDTRVTGLNSVTAPESTHQIFAGTATSEATLTNSMTMSLALLNTPVVKAKTLFPAIRPIKCKNGEYYICMLNPLQANALRQTTAANEWNAVYQSAMMGGKIEDNPIFTGAIGVSNGVILHEDARVPYGDNTQGNQNYFTDLGAAATGTTSVARAIFMGAQAGVMAFGRAYDWPHRYKWVEVVKDYENQLGVSVGSVFGCVKSIFNSKDFAVVVISTWAA